MSIPGDRRIDRKLIQPVQVDLSATRHEALFDWILLPYPTVPVTPDTVIRSQERWQVTLTCPHCGNTHSHDAGPDALDPELGHRWAPCRPPRHGFRATRFPGHAYHLVLVDNRQ